MEADLKEQKINIRGIGINYLKIGRGEHPVLLMPGSLGSIWKDFQLQVEQLDRNKFTIVAWDPPGYGNSRPPNREFSEDFLEKDAVLVNDLMQALGYKTFSMIGFCNGGRTAFVVAALYPDSVRKIVAISTNSYLLPEEIAYLAYIRDFNNWPETLYKKSIAIYGDEYFKRTWQSWMIGLENMCKKRNGDICTNFLDKIHCQTLIVLGGKDRFVNKSHGAFLNERIRNSRVHIFDDGSHAVHVTLAKEFNELATNFLLSN